MFIGLDIGTTNVKAVAFDDTGRVAASADEANAMRVEADGTATLDASDVADAACRVLAKVAARVGVGAVRGVGLSAAMHTMVPADHAGSPLAPATTWGDTRARAAEAKLRDEVEPRSLYEETGCPVRWLYWPARLRWTAEHRPDLFEAASRWVSIKEVVTHRLTGRWAVDVGIASSTGLLNVASGQWSTLAIGVSGLRDASGLSELVEGGAVVGGVTQAAARATGLRVGTPIVAGSSDGALANIGAVGVGVEETVITIGTSGAVRRMSEVRELDEHERTWCYAVTGGKPWLVGGAINNGGIVPAWVVSRFYSEEAGGFEKMFAEAAAVDVGADGVLCRPHLTGERSPWWDPAMTGVFSGLTLRHGRPAIARAALEGVAWGIASVWDSLGGTGRLGARARLTGGVTSSPTWCGILADVLGVTLEACENGDASARGAAMLAAVSAGAASIEQVNVWVRRDAVGTARYAPDLIRHEKYRELSTRWRDAEPLSH